MFPLGLYPRLNVCVFSMMRIKLANEGEFGPNKIRNEFRLNLVLVSLTKNKRIHLIVVCGSEMKLKLQPF